MRRSSQAESIRAATGFQDCLRRCEPCGIGASNGTAGPTFIHRDPLANIPDEIRSGARRVLAQSLNVQNRTSKWRRFGFSTSEDAVTWTVFASLWRSRRLVDALRATGLVDLDASAESTELLLWGAPLSEKPGCDLRSRLQAVCLNLGEDDNFLSEPDVVVDLGAQGLVFIEVKLGSGNDVQGSALGKWKKYGPALRQVADANGVRDSGLYELARNWCLLRSLAGDRPVILINLGPKALFEGQSGDRLARFASALQTDERCRFGMISWDDFLEPVLAESPDWLVRFCRERALISDAVERPTSGQRDRMSPAYRSPASDEGDQRVACHEPTWQGPAAPMQAAPCDLLELKDLLRRGPRPSTNGIRLDASRLAPAYAAKVRTAPMRRQGYLSAVRNGFTGSGSFSNREEEHLAVAIRNCGALRRPGGGLVRIVDYQAPLKAVRADVGIGKVDLLGLSDDGTLIVIELKVGGNREDRRLGLIEALGYAAIIEANVEAVAAEVEALRGWTVRRCRPDVMLVAPSRYWSATDLSTLRKLQRLASELGDGLQNRVELFCLDAELGAYGFAGAAPSLAGEPRCRALAAL